MSLSMLSNNKMSNFGLGFNSELAIFQPPVINVGIERLQWLEISPISQLTEDGSVDIVIPVSGSQYLDLKRSRIHVKAKIVKQDGSNCEKGDIVSPVNLWLSSLFSQVNVYLQQKLIGSAGTNYPYKAYLEVLLNYGIDAKESQCQTQLYYKDDSEAMDQTNPDKAPVNPGLIWRNKLSKNSAIVDMEGPLYIDFFQTNRYLINNVETRIKLFQSKNAFRLMAAGDSPSYRVIITEVIFKACKVTLSPDMIAAHDETIQKTPALYPFTRTEVKTFAIPKGAYNFSLNDMFQNEVPTRVIVAFVDGSTYSGDYKKNPFNFKHYDLEFLCCYVDGQSIPSKAIQPNFKAGNYIEAYQNLFTGLRKESLDLGLYCSRTDFASGYSLFCFDNKSELLDGSHFSNTTHGNLTLEGRFSSQLPETINVLVYASFPALLQIDQSRGVIF